MQTTGRIDGGLGSGGGIRLWCLTGSLKYVIQQMMERRVPSDSPPHFPAPPGLPAGGEAHVVVEDFQAPPPRSTRPSAAVYND